MKKILSVLILFSTFYILHTTSVSAALLVVTPQGGIVPQVLGDSTLEVKKVVENISPTPQIALTNDNGKVELNGIDVSSYKETLVELQARANSNDIKISGESGNFKIEENGIIAVTSFPLTVDPVKNEITVHTASGERIIAILPKEASDALIRAKFVNKVDKINLSENGNGQLEYQIAGTKNINLFNLANIDVKINAEVSATTGEILKLEEPTWLKIFGFVWQ